MPRCTQALASQGMHWSCSSCVKHVCCALGCKPSGPVLRDAARLSPRYPPIALWCLNMANLRDGETTIKIKFALLRGVGLGGGEENRPKTLFFVGNATTIKF